MPAVDYDRLRSRRDELDLSNADLAERLGVSEGYVGNILYGNDRPSNRLIHRFSRVLDLPVEDFRAGTRKPQGDPTEPPEQPPNEPKAPPRRKDDDKRGPKRPSADVRQAS